MSTELYFAVWGMHGMLAHVLQVAAVSAVFLIGQDEVTGNVFSQYYYVLDNTVFNIFTFNIQYIHNIQYSIDSQHSIFNKFTTFNIQ